MPKVRARNSLPLRVLRHIHEKSRISRSEIAAATGHSPFLTSKLCDQLLQSGFVSEIGSGDSTGGRRPTLLSVSPGLGRVVGVHLGTVNARVATLDLAGNLLAFYKAPSRVEQGPEIALPHLVSLIDHTIQQANVQRSELLGIGIGISGMFDKASGKTVFWPKVPTWVDVPVRGYLGNHFPILLEFDDTPRTIAMAERRWGCAQDSQNLVYLMLGAGIGAALFLNGRMYTGRDRLAGELGHITVEENGPLCSCGNRGCLESLMSATALIAQAQDAVTRGMSGQLWQLCRGDSKRISLELIVEAASANDRFALRLLNEAGSHIGKAIVTLLHLLNPEQIVIGGGMALSAGQLMLPAIHRVVQERALPRVASSLRMQLSELAEVDWARGAALLVIERALGRLYHNTVEAKKSDGRKLTPARDNHSAESRSERQVVPS